MTLQKYVFVPGVRLNSVGSRFRILSLFFARGELTFSVRARVVHPSLLRLMMDFTVPPAPPETDVPIASVLDVDLV